MLGGARDRSAIEATDQALIDKAAATLSGLAGVHAAPLFTRVIRHERAIPQYEIGHAERLTAIEGRLRRHPGLFLAGNSYRGIAINACIADAPLVAERVRALAP
jgi:oxygen-dependent protoporphyrinogen oxidase